MPVKKILIVDDSPTDRQFLLEVLSKAGYQRVTAENGDEAIAKPKTEQPDLILMDVVMPGTSGYQVTRAITRDEATKHIPVIMCTSKNQETTDGTKLTAASVGELAALAKELKGSVSRFRME